MSRNPRRIVTGHDRNGKSIVAIDTMLTPAQAAAAAGASFYEIWNTAGSPTPVDSGADPTGRKLQIAPPPSGSIVRFVDFQPEAQRPPAQDGAAARKAFEAIGSGGDSTWRPGAPHPFMHRTETVDYGIVLEGEITLILDDSEVTLKASDVVIQRGTDHAWANRSDKICRMAFILLDGKFAPELQAALNKH